MTPIVLVVVALFLVAVVAAVATVAITAAVRRSARRSTQVVPGHDSPAPPGWARGHTPEARLHRRLRDAVAALRALPDTGGPSAAVWADLDRYALTLDQVLVSVAALPEGVREPALARCTADVEAIEAAAGRLAEQAAAGSLRGVEIVTALGEQVEHLTAARAEVDAIESGDPPVPPSPAVPPATDG